MRRRYSRRCRPGHRLGMASNSWRATPRRSPPEPLDTLIDKTSGVGGDVIGPYAFWARNRRHPLGISCTFQRIGLMTLSAAGMMSYRPLLLDIFIIMFPPR
jgi:hypothetical protein